MGLLSLAIWTPIVFGAVVLAFGKQEQAKMVRWIALIGALVGLLVTLPLYTGFQLGTSAMQFVEKASWIPRVVGVGLMGYAVYLLGKAIKYLVA